MLKCTFKTIRGVQTPQVVYEHTDRTIRSQAVYIPLCCIVFTQLSAGLQVRADMLLKSFWLFTHTNISLYISNNNYVINRQSSS